MKTALKARPAPIHAAAFLLPVLGLFATYVAVGIYPFGELSVLAIDSRNQYVSFFAYLRDNLLLGGQSWLYTFSKALGGDMAGFSAYYLLSPFNLLLLFFPTKHLALGIEIMTLLKVGCCGLAMSLLLNRRGPRFASLLFSVPFALMDYVTAFQSNIMWLDGVILLPIVVIGIERLWEGKSPLCYVLALFAAIVTCYYIGFVLCVFSLLYIILLFFFFARREKRALRQPAQWKPFGRFALASLLGGGLSAACLLPAMLSLAGGKASFTLENLFEPSFVILPDVASRYLPGTVNMGMIFFGYPHIYCGMLALLCAALYLCDAKIPRRRRLGAGLLLLALIASFCIGPLNLFWHGFNKPVGFLFRYSFLFSFALLYLGWLGWRRLRKGEATRRLPLILGGIVAAVLLVWRSEYTHLTTGKVLLGFGLAAVMALALHLRAKRRWRPAVLALLALVLADLGASVYLGLRRVEYFPYAYYYDFVRIYQPVAEAVKEKDKGFYRMENLDAFSDNDAMLLGYFGLTHFSSSDKMAVRHFLEYTGFSEGTNSVKYSDGSTVAMDNLLGVKYLFGRRVMPKPYTPIGESYGIITWENPQALPLGFMVGPGAAEGLSAAPEENLFEVQNAMWRRLCPWLEEDLYRPAGEAAVETVNLTVGEFYGEAIYNKIDPEAEAYVAYTLTAESDDDLYLHLTTLNYRGAEVYVNGEKWEDDYFNSNRHGILALGSYAPGSQVEVRLLPKARGELLIMDAFFAYESRGLLGEITNELARNAYEVESFSQSRFSGNITVNEGDKSLLLLSIPYDEGWKARLDGQPVKTLPALGALTAIEVPPGSHRLELSYTPSGLWAGAAISAASLLGLLAWIWLRKRQPLVVGYGINNKTI